MTEKDRQKKVFKNWEKDDPGIKDASICPKCGGQGYRIDSKSGNTVDCPKCKGKGTI